MTGQPRIEITVFRFELETDEAPHYETYQVPAGRGYMILDALSFIRENYDSTLRFRALPHIYNHKHHFDV